MNTLSLVTAKYNSPVILLSDICDEFLGINIETANKLANANKLPFKVFKLYDSIHAPWVIHAKDYADHIDHSHGNATKVTTKITGNDWLKKPLLKSKQ